MSMVGLRVTHAAARAPRPSPRNLFRHHDGRDVGIAARAVGMIEASTTRRPAIPRTRSPVSTTASRSLAPPMRQVPTGWNVPATFSRICVGKRVRRPPPALRDRRGGRPGVEKIGPASGGIEIDERGDERALKLVGRRDAVEPAQAVGEFHRKGHAGHGAHLLVRQDFDRAAERPA